MEMTEPSATFPIVFYDGDKESDCGKISLPASTTFDRFLGVVGMKTGFLPSHISTSLFSCMESANWSPYPINESSDFSFIARQRNCHVLAVPKSLNREQKGRASRGKADVVEMKTTPKGIAGAGEKLEAPGALVCPNCSRAKSVGAGKKLEAPEVWGCQECSKEKSGTEVSFHSCVFDKVVVDFRTTAGPIQRPAKEKTGGATPLG